MQGCQVVPIQGNLAALHRPGVGVPGLTGRSSDTPEGLNDGSRAPYESR
jgi:hypothetical protein